MPTETEYIFEVNDDSTFLTGDIYGDFSRFGNSTRKFTLQQKISRSRSSATSRLRNFSQPKEFSEPLRYTLNVK